MGENLNNYFIGVIKNHYADFKGRSSRKAYWTFVGINFLFSFASSFVEILGILYSLALLLPSLAIAVRRMHDVGKSGWFLLIPFYNIYLLIIKGEERENQYGPVPID
ncbi:DUF805 domain-containing protein [Riemerella anatipestifer]|uniref:DUF805 domain-containing protein n=1 Tax=Riemerella anatipestifer TaxID=34085 RepID=UPI0012AD277E|nr:DUF805 domain-containing protein [Riemerella anatipestifer]USL95792.1 DUF805 domain-containing protein [Riemerella anatipestifer]